MNKKLIVGAVAALATLSPTALAADHQDGPQATGSPTLDITDLYVWTDQADATKFDMVMDVTPAASAGTSLYSNTGQYIFNLSSYTKYGAPLFVPAVDKSQLICTFDDSTPQKVSCWLQVNGATVDYATGDASAPTGITSVNGNLKVFTGPRQDPFYFNLDGFKNALSFVAQNAASLNFDAQGCPTLNTSTSATVVNDLGTAPDGSPALDHFAGLDVLSIVAQVRTSAVTPSDTSTSKHPVLGVWASTRL